MKVVKYDWQIHYNNESIWGGEFYTLYRLGIITHNPTGISISITNTILKDLQWIEDEANSLIYCVHNSEFYKRRQKLTIKADEILDAVFKKAFADMTFDQFEGIIKLVKHDTAKKIVSKINEIRI